VEGRWSLLHHPDGSPRAALAIHTDVTERRRLETELLRELEIKATHDPLTGLANRLLLFDRLELLLSQRHGPGVALAFLDLDGFKAINDAHGHRAGDDVLRAVGTRLTGAVRHGDVVARIGGDEFVVVGEAEDEQTALALGQRLAAAVHGTYASSAVAVEVSVSVGVAFVSSGDPVGADELLSRADAVMYEAKRRESGSAALPGPVLLRE
jgi:diguanylate cyclase (GGDEF)-like protein